MLRLIFCSLSGNIWNYPERIFPTRCSPATNPHFEFPIGSEIPLRFSPQPATPTPGGVRLSPKNQVQHAPPTHRANPRSGPHPRASVVDCGVKHRFQDHPPTRQVHPFAQTPHSYWTLDLGYFPGPWILRPCGGGTPPCHLLQISPNIPKTPQISANRRCPAKIVRGTSHVPLQLLPRRAQDPSMRRTRWGPFFPAEHRTIASPKTRFASALRQRRLTNLMI